MRGKRKDEEMREEKRERVEKMTEKWVNGGGSKGERDKRKKRKERRWTRRGCKRKRNALYDRNRRDKKKEEVDMIYVWERVTIKRGSENKRG